jgi:TP901 family phage tail tape measure protein
MAGFSAGEVSASLSGDFNPAGFVRFNAAMTQSESAMKKAEATIAASANRASNATDRMGHSSMKAAGLHQDAAGRWRNASGQFASDSEKAAAGVAKAAGSVEQSSGRMQKAMHKVAEVAKGAAVGGILAIGAAIYKSVSLAADFEQQMSNLSATLMKNGALPAAKDMDALKKSALAAGAATKFSALDAAKAQVELAKGGLSTANILGGGLSAALALASAGEMDLALAAETTVNAMKQFGIHGAQAGHVADALATAANSTTVDVTDLALALRQGGGVANMAGASFDGTVAAIEAMADASIKGADAGTSLKSFFLNIATPSKQAAEAMHGLGLNIFTTTGDLKTMPAIAENLRHAFGNLTKEQFLNKAGVIAGSDAARALFAIYRAGPAGMARYEQELKKQGTAAEVAKEKQNNLKGAIENFKGSLETAGIILGEGLLPGLTEGAKKLTEVINKMGETGQLDSMAKDLSSAMTAIIEAGPQIGDSMKIAGQGVHVLFDLFRTGGAGVVSDVVAPIELILRSIRAAADAANTLNPFGDVVDTGGLSNMIDKLASFRDSAKSAAGDVSRDVQGISRSIDNFGAGGGKTVTFKIKGDASEAVAALKRVQSAGISAKVMRILGKDESAAQKIKEIRALGIGPKTAKILGDNADAIAKLGGVQGAIAAIPRSVTINVGASTGAAIGQLASVRSAANATGTAIGSALGKRKGHATGRAPGDHERALVGEGHGGELVGNQADGWTWVTRPTLMDLAPSDAVIPTDPQYSGRALGFMLAALGVPGYAKGKPAKKPAKKKAAAQALPIPDAITFGSVPEDELNNEKDQARNSYQKRKDRVHKLDVEIRDQHKKVTAAKAGPARRKAQQHLNDLQRDRHRYNDGGDGLASLTAMRKKWEDLSAQARVLHATNLEIERLNQLQENDRTKMATASKRGDGPAWAAARKDRAGLLAKLREDYANALKYAKPGSNFAAELEGKLASVEGDIADAASEAYVPDSPFDSSGLSAAEVAQLDKLQAAQSLAGLTADLGDDQATAAATEQFLTGMLAAALADPSRGGASVIGALADQVKTARDNVASLTSGGGGGGAVNQSADLQAQIDRANRERDIAQSDARTANLGLSVFQGAGDIGSGFTQNNYMLHPADPRVLATIAGASVAGMSQQASRTSPRTNLGL